MKQDAAKTHAKRALLELRQRIVDGELPGGMRLYEVALAEKLQISRTPVREAMSRLAEEGLLDRASGGGFQVRSFTFRDVVDAIELRGILEGTVARLAAERGVDAAQMAPVRSIMTDLDKCFGETLSEVDFDQYSELNGYFHDEFAKLCNSNLLLRELERAKSLPFASPSAFLPDKLNIAAFSKSLFVAQAQHHTLVEAVENRESARAESIAREHARIALSNLEFLRESGADLIAKMPSLAIVVD